MTKKKAHKPGSATIALNKRARHEYFIEDEYEAGLALQGWEVKSLRAGKANIGDSYVILKDGEAFLFGANFTPMAVASTHYVCDPTRTRKLLLNQRELDTLYGRINREGYTVVEPLREGRALGTKCLEVVTCQVPAFSWLLPVPAAVFLSSHPAGT